MISPPTTRRLVPALLALLATPPALAAQPADGPQLTLRAAVERARAQFPALAASRAAVEEAEAAAGEARAARFPSLRLSASATRYEEPMIVSPIHGFTPGTVPPFDETLIQSGTSLTYTLFDGGARGSRIRQARSRAQAVEANLEGAEGTLTARVVATYLDVLGRARVLAAHDRRLDALRVEMDRARRRLEVGRAARVDLLRVEAALAGAEAERVRLVHALDNAERDLARLVGAEPEQTRAAKLATVTLADTTRPDRAELLERALEANPAVRQARREAAAADAGAGAARAARWPELRAVGNYLTFGGGKVDHTAEWNAGVQLSYPLFAGGAISSGVDRAEAARRRARDELRLAEIVAAQEIDRALSAVEEARARRASLTTAAARSEEVARIEALRLDLGTGTQADYLEAEAGWLVAQAARVEAEYREIAARAELARVTGALNLDWLSTALETPR